jgi:hypothetical protein
MKTLLKTWIPFIFVALIASSCQDDIEKANVDELSDYARNFVSMRLGGASAKNSLASNMGSGNPANESFQRLNSNFNGLSNGGRIAGDSTNADGGVSPGDSTIVDSPWQTCAVITTVTNNDGSVTTTYDYGDGCWEGNDWYKYWMHGKFSNTYRAEQSQIGTKFFDTYFYASTYENYGGSYYYDTTSYEWLTDGGGTYSGSSEYDTAKQTYKGSYEYTDATTSLWDTVEYAYTGNGKSYYDEKKTVQERNDYEYKSGNDFYSTTVLKPLVSNYDCNPYLEDGLALRCWFITYVSGRERIEYRQGTESGSFEVDYGDGECDRIITIIEGGKKVEIDLGNDLIIPQ